MRQNAEKGSALCRPFSIFAFILGLRLLVKKVAEKFDDVLASGVRRLGIISHGGATFDTKVIETGGLTCITVDDHALRPFLEAAFAILGWRLRVPYRARDSLVAPERLAAISRPEGSGLMHTFSDSYTLGKFNPPSYASWLTELRTLFPIPEEFLLADAIFSFPNAFKEGKTPQQAYEGFDIFVSAEA